MYWCFKKIIALLFCFVVFSYGQNIQDDKIFEALSFIDVGDYKSAIGIYNELYEATNNLEYLQEVIKLSASIGDIDNTLRYINEYQNVNNNNLEIKYILAGIYMTLKDSNNAISVYEEIIRLENRDFSNKTNLKTLGGLYALQRSFNNAQKYLMQSYALEKDMHTLLLIASVDISLDDFDHSVPLIKDYFKSEIDDDFAQVITQLAFSNKILDDVEDLFSFYYDKNPNVINANNLFRIYVLDDNFDDALDLAYKYDLNLETIVDKYLSIKDYKNARTILEQLIDKKNDVYYYGVMAIIDFEEAEDKMVVVDSVINNFKIALKDANYPLFANYLGYLLIDYDIDINEGIQYVRNALKEDPKNPAYLDSLAWGYYKLHQCKEAFEVINAIPKEILEHEKEIKEHLGYIENCLQK